jgi:hypothetical protein
MRSTRRCWLVGLGIVAVSSVLSLFAPAPAHASDCYTVSVGTDGFTVCPWQ